MVMGTKRLKSKADLVAGGLRAMGHDPMAGYSNPNSKFGSAKRTGFRAILPPIISVTA
ncbi:hypothetical protein JCGZ_05103 [Jatropha curcas]|uniref:Uncharacterized protein n=1 Tax=Jatropha curcas TaxID=180498 RepID=A0A067LF22_JATCU|nr:hypothetical protein JCGZ_05103 [Jatropha curcas]